MTLNTFLIDTHCHLEYLEDLNQVFINASQNNVRAFINPSVNANSINKIKQIQKSYQNIFLAVGIHPEEVEHKTELEIESEINIIDNELKDNKSIIAIGECGLDFAFGNVETRLIASLQNRQLQLFKQHIIWAKKYKLPLIIHNRKAGDQIFDLVNSVRNADLRSLQGVLHCFTGSKKFVEKILNHTNFYFGIGGLLTLDSGLQEVIKHIPLDRIVLETDSPYLVPREIKDRIVKNQPAYIIHTALKIAEIKKISLDEVARITTINTQKLFNISFA